MEKDGHRYRSARGCSLYYHHGGIRKKKRGTTGLEGTGEKET